eukprot:6301283-Amphidinium_carterae.1
MADSLRLCTICCWRLGVAIRIARSTKILDTTSFHSANMECTKHDPPPQDAIPTAMTSWTTQRLNYAI